MWYYSTHIYVKHFYMKILLGLLVACFMISHTWAQSPTNLKRNGVTYYQIIEANAQNPRKTTAIDLLDLDYRMAVGSNDSILYETFTSASRVTIGVNHPSFMPIFKQVKKGDKVTIIVSADSFYKYTLQQPFPTYLKHGDSLHFFFKVYDVMNEREFAKKEYAKELAATKADSISFAQQIQKYNRLKKTPSGLCYVVSAYGTGKQVTKGSTVTVKYKAYLFDGKVFERNTEGYTFTVGKQQVIDGWEEALLLMSEGARYKFIIPQNLAYGASGTDIVPPFTSVIFDVELIKVN